MRNGLFGIYAAVALVGAAVPYAIFLPWAAEHGLAPGLFGGQLFATAPSSIFSFDALYSGAVFILFAVVEGRRVGMRHLWLYPLVAVTVGLCCALPLFLAVRERACARAR